MTPTPITITIPSLTDDLKSLTVAGCFAVGEKVRVTVRGLETQFATAAEANAVPLRLRIHEDRRGDVALYPIGDEVPAWTRDAQGALSCDLNLATVQAYSLFPRGCSDTAPHEVTVLVELFTTQTQTLYASDAVWLYNWPKPNDFEPEIIDIDTRTYYTKAQVDALLAAKYTLPQGGIPKTDLAAAVQTSLGKADTALQDATAFDPAGTAASAVSSHDASASAHATLLASKQDTISDLATIRSNADLGAQAKGTLNEKANGWNETRADVENGKDGWDYAARIANGEIFVLPIENGQCATGSVNTATLPHATPFVIDTEGFNGVYWLELWLTVPPGGSTSWSWSSDYPAVTLIDSGLTPQAGKVNKYAVRVFVDDFGEVTRIEQNLYYVGD